MTSFIYLLFYQGTWIDFYAETYIHTSTSYSLNDLDLSPGKSYRVTIKPCAGATCFTPVESDGVLVLANRPTTGKLNVTHQDTATIGTANEKVY